jgi:hypothetical protein
MQGCSVSFQSRYFYPDMVLTATPPAKAAKQQTQPLQWKKYKYMYC